MKKATTSNETRANTRGLISRSLTATLATLLVYNKVSKQNENANYTMQGEKSERDIVAAFNKEFGGEFIALDIIELKTETHLYAMNIETFIANSVIMD